MTQAPLVRVTRSGLVESVHSGSVAVGDASGKLLAYAGDVTTVAFARSAMKPLQAAVSLATIDADTRGRALDDGEIAVAAGSHNGEATHLDTVRALLRRAGLEEDALLCPPSLPLDADSALAATQRRRLFHNCSGKHAAMLLACVAAGYETATYVEPDHPLQGSVLDAIRAAAGEPQAIGVDGCGLPVHALSLAEMAMLYARLARPDTIEGWGASVERVTGAMRSEPYLVEGKGRTATALMQAREGVVAKGGAEGLACAAFVPEGIGVAVKVADGGARAATPALVRALGLLGVLDETAEARLADVARPAVLGGGRPVGELVADFALSTP